MSKKLLFVGLMTVAVIAITVLAGASLETEVDDSEAATTSQSFRANVVRVIDGDTLTVRVKKGQEYDVGIEGDIVDVRLIGIDAPEINWKESSGECFGFASRKYLQSLLRNKEIVLQPDSVQPARDKYGRYLFYVYFNEKNVSYRVLRKGYARELTIGNGYDKQKTFRKAAVLAQKGDQGLWGQCD